MATSEKTSKWYRKLIFFLILSAVLLIFILKLVFLISRYGLTALGISCEQIGSNLTTAVRTEVNHEYIFTVIMYVIVNVLRIVEYVLIGKQFYFFFFQQMEIDPWTFFTKHSKRFCYLLLFFIVLLPYFLLGFAIPALGIYQEIEHTEQLEKCYRHYHEIYITYCAVNFFRYASAFIVRIGMIYTALFIDKLWFPDNPPGHTSLGLDKSLGYSSDCEEIDAVIIGTSAESGGSSTVANINSTDELFNVKFLQDWKIVSTDYKQIFEKYHEIGKQVQVYQELFQTWFIVPWIIYFINSSLKTYNVLRPWNLDGDGDTPPSDIPSIYYLLFNIIQLITLIIPFLCAKKINTYHHKYFKHMRTEQIKRYMNQSGIHDPSKARCLSFARQLMVDRNDRYDFEPRLVGTSITVSIGNPLFVILLLVGLLLSVSESLL
jgi:hypothetical protein